jgi:putative transposase
MANHFKVEITESLDILKHLLKSQTTAQGKERLQMLYWLKSGQLKTRQDLAHRLDRDESTIYRWLQRYRQRGLDGLLNVKAPPGKTPQIRGSVLEQLKQRLSQPEGFASYGAIQDWLAQTCGLNIPYSTVYRTVRSRLKAKLKVPRPRSQAVDEQHQQTYKKNCRS